MATRIQSRGDTAANWTAANPVLADREIGLETDTNRLKVGDGGTAWNSLGYFEYANPSLTNLTATTADITTLSADTADIGTLSADTIYSGSTNLYDIFATSEAGSDQHPYDVTAAASDETTDITTGTNKVKFLAAQTFTLTGVTATLSTSGSTDSVVDVNLNGSSVLSSPITIPSGNFYSAATSSTSAITRYDTFAVDIDTAGTGAKGLKVILLGYYSV